jgi:hypothetical protein
MSTGCSKAVEIPRADIDDPKYREEASYRIRLEGREEYLANRFSVTDSTVVVEELLPADERYRLERTTLPITIPISQVSSIAQLETDAWKTYGVVLGIGAAITFLVVWATMDWNLN